MKNQKYIVKYYFPCCSWQVVENEKKEPLLLDLDKANLIANRLGYKYGAYTTIEEVK